MTDDQLRAAITRARQVADRKRGDLDALETAITDGLLILGGRRSSMERAQVEAILSEAPLRREVVVLPEAPFPVADDYCEEVEPMEVDG